MSKRIKKIVSITMTDKDKAKLDAIAASLKLNRSEAARMLIRSKRIPRKSITRRIILR